MPKQRGCRLPALLKEDDDMINLLPPGVKLIPNLVTRAEENPQENHREIGFDKVFRQHCNVVYLRTRLHAGIIPNEQIRQDLHPRLLELFLLKHAGTY